MLQVPTVDQVGRILRKHGFPADSVAPAPQEGIANNVFYAGRVVVRVGHDPEYHCDAYREPITVPIALASGVRMARLLLLDDDRDVFQGPVTVYERIAGVTATRVELSDSFYRQIGEQIALLHSTASRIPIPTIENPGYQDPGPQIEECARRSLIDQEETRYWLDWRAKLLPGFDGQPAHVFLHNDLHLGNLLASPDGRELVAILDWSDAGWWDPAVEFRSLPMEGTAIAIEAYRRHLEVDNSFELRVISESMSYAFRKLLKAGERTHIDALKAFRMGAAGRWRT